MANIATEDAGINHYGSTIAGPVASTINLSAPSHVTIEGKQVLSSEDTVDTPTHAFDPGPPLQFHAHPGQSIDTRAQSHVTIEGSPILLENDSNVGNDTRIDSAGQINVTIS